MWTRRTLLASLGASVIGVPAGAATSKTKLVVVVSAGGWDPTFSVDPKPHLTNGGPYPDLNPFDLGDREVLETYGPIEITTNAARRPQVKAFFDQWSDHVTVVNGLWTGSLGHWQAMDQILTGTTDPNAPDFGVVVGTALGDGLPLAQLDLSGVSRFGPLASRCARAGVRGQFAGLLDPSVRFDAPTGARPEPFLTAADRAALDQFRAARATTVRPSWSAARAERDDALARAASLRARADQLVSALPAGRRTTFADQIPFAVELLATDTCATVAIGTGFAWDSHGDASRQHAAWNGTFGGLSSLCAQLQAAGLFERTMIVAVSELGRAPIRNTSGGTDHWPYTSAIVIRGTPTGPRRLGGTDINSVGSGTDLYYGTFAAGVIAAAGADPELWLPGIPPLDL